MKISQVALSLVSMMATMPAVTQADSAFNCMVEANYSVLAEDISDVMPSTIEKYWANARLMEAYNNAHNNDDYELFTSTLESFETDRTTDDLFEENEDGDSSHLRPRKPDGNRLMFYTRDRSRNFYGCTFCSADDDYNPYTVSTSPLAHESSSVHKDWEKTWCHLLTHGPYPVFHDVKDCTVTMFDCLEDFGEVPTFAETDMEEALPNSFTGYVAKVAADLLG